MSQIVETPKSHLTSIFLTVFLYLLSFGIIIPILPNMSRDFGASALQTGLLMSSYSFMQFLIAPYWGRLSDRVGRRPILISCLLGEALCYLIFAFARNLEMLFVARILAGLFAASISTASAAIGDITSSENRSKSMALIGIAFGLGFVIGPALGGGLASVAQSFSSEPYFESRVIGFFVSALCFATFIFAYFRLPESLHERNRQTAKVNRLGLIYSRLREPVVGPLIWVFFLVSFSMSSMEATLVLFMKDKFHWGIRESSFGFVYIGILLVFTQGFLVRKFVPKWGERFTLVWGIGLFVLGLAGIAVANDIGSMAVTMTLLSVGNGLCNPSLLGSISLMSSKSEQGESMGVTQGLSSLGRILGPALGGIIYDQLSREGPFLFSASLALIGALVLMKIFKHLPQPKRSVHA